MRRRMIGISTMGLIAILGLSACGGSSGDSSDEGKLADSATDVTVERGKVYGATVQDASNPRQTAMQKTGQNIYTFASTPTYPISATGGWIDINDNGVQDIHDIPLDIVLQSYSDVITPITTYIADESKTRREQKLTALKERLNDVGVGLDEMVTNEELLKVASQTNNLDVVLLMNAIYKEIKEQGGDLENSNEDSIFSQFNSIAGSGSTAQEIEESVVETLVGAGFTNYISEVLDNEDNGDEEENTNPPTSEGLASIDVGEIVGHTITTTVGNGVIKQRAYIFEPNLGVTMVFDRKDGGQYVHKGSYVLNDDSHTLTVELQFDSHTFLYYVLFYDENHLIHAKEYISLSMTVTSITANEDSGVVIQDDQPLGSSDALSIDTIKDLYGYTLYSNLADDGMSSIVTINCDGSSSTKTTYVYGGQSYSDTTQSSAVELREDQLIYKEVDVGESWLLLSSTNQLVENKTCFSSLDDDGTCFQNYKLERIEKTQDCQ